MSRTNAIYLDSRVSDDERRNELFSGEIFLFSPTEESRALRDYAAELLGEAFAPLNPETAQFEMPVERFVSVLDPLKRRYTHSPVTKQLIEALLASLGCSREETHWDVPRLRAVTSDRYLTAGVGYVHPPHRDTWWSAPLAQVNWWMPIYELGPTRSLAIHPSWWSRQIENHSEDFSIYTWNAVGRAEAAKHIYSDTRQQPHPPEDFDPEPQVRYVLPVGGLIAFAGAQLHSTVPNTSGRTRFSTDFRTINAADLLGGHGAPNVDSRPQGTSLRDFKRLSDGADLPADLVARYDHGARPEDGVLVFEPGETS
jgi:hypothetical protein